MRSDSPSWRYYEPPDPHDEAPRLLFSSSRRVNRTAKDHKCGECGFVIEAGLPAEKVAYKDDENGFTAYYRHLGNGCRHFGRCASCDTSIMLPIDVSHGLCTECDGKHIRLCEQCGVGVRAGEQPRCGYCGYDQKEDE